MKALLVWVGKTVEPWLVSGIDNYAKRLKHYLPFEVKEIPALKNVKSLSSDQLKTKEGELILSVLQPGDFWCCSMKTEKHCRRGNLRLCSIPISCKDQTHWFVIGGAYRFFERSVCGCKTIVIIVENDFFPPNGSGGFS
jgi:23S rRNA pseudoU1915 N3-methylase RlmH